ncbi:hypothetical protein ACRAWF_10755 [Streptomyces sp. L7]
MSSSPETSTRTTGAHRAHREARDRAAARTPLAQCPPPRYEPYLDGLFTYCLSVLEVRTTTRRRRPWGTCSRWPNAGVRACRRRPVTAGPGCTRWPAGRVRASWPRPSRNVRAPTRRAGRGRGTCHVRGTARAAAA